MEKLQKLKPTNWSRRTKGTILFICMYPLFSIIGFHDYFFKRIKWGLLHTFFFVVPLIIMINPFGWISCSGAGCPEMIVTIVQFFIVSVINYIFALVEIIKIYRTL